MATTTGTIASVDVVTLGDNLTVAASIGDTTITVDDTTDFDSETGGTLTLGGVQYGYSAVDDDTGIITLATPLTAAAAVDDRVDVWDVAAGAPAVECRALVATVDEVDAGDTLEAVVSHALVPLLPEGIRDPGTGEVVTLEERSGEWVVTDVRGKAPAFDGSRVRPGTIPADALSFQAGSTTVTIAAAAPSAPNVGDLWLDTTSGNQLNQWNGTAWAPLQFGTDAIAAGAITADLIAAEAIVAEKIAAGALDAYSITAIILSAVSMSGNMTGSEIDDSDFIVDDSGGRILIYRPTSTPTVVTLSTVGTGTWTVPTGVTSVKAECWAGGGSGAGSANGGSFYQGGGGGQGGDYVRNNAIPVTPGAGIPYQVGGGALAGGPNSNGSQGGNTWFGNSITLSARGGSGGSDGNGGGVLGSGSSVGPVRFSGGYGGGGGSHYPGPANLGGGGGGESASAASNGNNGANASGSSGAAGGNGTPGGNGGAGGASTANGNNGLAPGGGGGGGGLTSGGTKHSGGNGADGKIVLTYYVAGNLQLVASIAGVAGTDQYGNTYPAGVRVLRPDLNGLVSGYYEEVKPSAQSISSTAAGFTQLTSLAASQLASDSGSAFNLSTGVWTCPVTGVYEFTFSLAFSAWVASSRLFFAVMRSAGATANQFGKYDATSDSGMGSITVQKWITAGETVTFRGGQVTGSAQTIANSDERSYIAVRRCS